MPSRRERNFLLCEGFDLIPNDIDTSNSSKVSISIPDREFRREERLTVHQKHSTPKHLPYMHSQVIGGQDNGYSSSSQYLEDPVRPSPPPPSVELPHVGIPRHTEIIICGQFPSFAITFNRSIVSSFPTTSSKTFGRYFSTLGGARTRCQKGHGERKENENFSYHGSS